MEMNIKIMNCNEQTLAVCHSSGDGRSIVYTAQYREGDRICTEVEQSGLYAVRLDEALPEAVVYLNGKTFVFPVPCGKERDCYPPKAFSGSCHLITLRPATAQEAALRRNLAFNPYDRHATTGCFPHATANVETRNEAVFAARNALDGVFENCSHGVYPYSSWGINRDPDAELRLDFGRTVTLDALRLTLRADFPHDNWWREAAVSFSDGSSMKLSLQKTHLPQLTKLEPRRVEWLTLGKLIKSDEPSPFPALTQLEAFGVEG